MPVKMDWKVDSSNCVLWNHMYNKTKPGMYMCNPINLRCTPQECQHKKKIKIETVGTLMKLQIVSLVFLNLQVNEIKQHTLSNYIF